LASPWLRGARPWARHAQSMDKKRTNRRRSWTKMDENGRIWTDMDGKSRGATEFGGSSWECSSLVPRRSRPVPPPQWEHLIWEAMEMTTSREPIDDILEAIEDAQRAVAIAQERLLGIEEAWAQEAKDVWLVTAREALRYALRRLTRSWRTKLVVNGRPW
jgi:hypothetical protein